MRTKLVSLGLAGLRGEPSSAAARRFDLLEGLNRQIMTLNDEEIAFLQHSNAIEGEGQDAFDDSAKAWLQIRDMPRLGVQDVLNCHAVLMRSRKTIPTASKGVWTGVRTRVGGRLNPEPRDVPELMIGWIKDINENVQHHVEGCTEERPLEKIKAEDAQNYHIAFERIHPFEDGNGRVGRILYEWHRLRLGLPIHVISEDHNQEYYSWFR